MLQSVVECCSAWQRVAVLQCVAVLARGTSKVLYILLLIVAGCFRVLQSVAVCYSVLQYVAVCCGVTVFCSARGRPEQIIVSHHTHQSDCKESPLGTNLLAVDTHAMRSSEIMPSPLCTSSLIVAIEAFSTSDRLFQWESKFTSSTMACVYRSVLRPMSENSVHEVIVAAAEMITSAQTDKS